MVFMSGEDDSFVEGGRLVLGYEYGIGVAVLNDMRLSLIAFILFSTRVVQPGMGTIVARLVSPCDSADAFVLRDSPVPMTCCSSYRCKTARKSPHVTLWVPARSSLVCGVWACVL